MVWKTFVEAATQAARSAALKEMPNIIESQEPKIEEALVKALNIMKSEEKALFLENWNKLNVVVQRELLKPQTSTAIGAGLLDDVTDGFNKAVEAVKEKVGMTPSAAPLALGAPAAATATFEAPAPAAAVPTAFGTSTPSAAPVAFGAFRNLPGGSKDPSELVTPNDNTPHETWDDVLRKNTEHSFVSPLALGVATNTAAAPEPSPAPVAPAAPLFSQPAGGMFSEVQYNPTTFPPPMAPTRHKKRTKKRRLTKRNNKK